MVSGEELKARCDFRGVLWPGAATHLTNLQGLGMAVLSQRFYGSLWAVCHLHRLAASAFMLCEAQRPA
jgi:hypothetical protein